MLWINPRANLKRLCIIEQVDSRAPSRVIRGLCGYITTHIQIQHLHNHLFRVPNSNINTVGVNVAAFMWLRTIMCYQQAHGTKMAEVSLGLFAFQMLHLVPTSLTNLYHVTLPPLQQAIRTLYRQGGVRRFYHGFVPALIHAPISRFGDTAANAGMPMYVTYKLQYICHRETKTSLAPHGRRARPLRPVPRRQGGPHYHQDRLRLRRLSCLARWAHAVSLEIHTSVVP